MAIKIVEERKKLSDYSDLNLQTRYLDNVLQEALSKVRRESSGKGEKENIRVYVPGKCDIGIFDNSVSIYASKGNSIDMEKLLKEVTLLLQQKHNLPNFESHMAINFRYGKHSVQFRSGHLERNDKEQLLPMHEVLDRSDQTMIRTLKTLKDLDVKPTLSSELDSYSLQDSNVAMGFFREAKEAILEGGSRKEAAQKFGFKIMAKRSEGRIPNGAEEQTCIAERLCVYAEEYKGDDVAKKVIETYRMVQKVRNDPPVIMGLKSIIEIHADRSIITLNRQNSSSETFSEFLTKLFEIVGITDMNALTFEYRKQVEVEDTPFQKWIDNQVDRVNRFSDWVGDNKHNISFSLLSMSILLLFAFLLSGDTLFEATMIMVPSLAVIVLALLFSEKNGTVKKVGQGSVMFFFAAFFVIAADLASISFDTYMSLLKMSAVGIAIVVAWIVAAVQTEAKREELVKNIKEWLIKTAQNIEVKLGALSKKALASKKFVTVLTALLIIAGVAVTIMIGVIMIPFLIVAVVFIPIMIILDRRFWRELEADRQRTLDKFFEDFRAKREDLPEACEVRFEITKCKKLRNPFRGIPTKFAKYAKSKYPKSLTLGGFKQTATKLITGSWAEKTLRGEQ